MADTFILRDGIDFPYMEEVDFPPTAGYSFDTIILPGPTWIWKLMDDYEFPICDITQIPPHRGYSYETMISPGPLWIWKLMDDYEFPICDPNKENVVGACVDCVNLSTIVLPLSLDEIGYYTFRNTNIHSATFAVDCIRHPMSFPDDCMLSYFPYTETHTDPTKTIYDLNEAFNPTGSSMTITSNHSGNTKTKTHNRLYSKDFDSSNYGDHTCSVGYYDATFPFTYTVNGGYLYFDNIVYFHTVRETETTVPVSYMGDPKHIVECLTFSDDTTITNIIFQDGVTEIG